MLNELLDDDADIPLQYTSISPESQDNSYQYPSTAPTVLPPMPPITTTSPMDFQPPIPTIPTDFLGSTPLLSGGPLPISILDFSPSWDHITGGAKVLVILSSSITPDFQQDAQVRIKSYDNEHYFYLGILWIARRTCSHVIPNSSPL